MVRTLSKMISDDYITIVSLALFFCSSSLVMTYLILVYCWFCMSQYTGSTEGWVGREGDVEIYNMYST